MQDSYVGRQVYRGLIAAALCSGIFATAIVMADTGTDSTEAFATALQQAFPEEESFSYHKQLSTAPVHKHRRDPDARPTTQELEIVSDGWRLIEKGGHSPVLAGATRDFKDYLKRSMDVQVAHERVEDLVDWRERRRSIIVGTREDLPGFGEALSGPKDYEILVTGEQIVVCGYDERGAMFGLYNIEARMNLREAPFLPADLHSVRHSLYDTRMVQSWMGWMEFPDAVLSHMAHDGFDAVFASVYTNPNGDRTTAENSTDFYARLMRRIRRQDPARVRSLIDRAKTFGIKVYTPIIYQYVGTPESEADLRRLVRELLRDFPDIEGYVLLTEGFWFKAWGGGHGASKSYIEDWARNWSHAVGVVTEECHKVNPNIEILPWEYNIDFRPKNVDTKRYFIQQLPDGAIPMLTWENGKSFEIDEFKGTLRDYAINVVGPAEVTAAQIGEARKRGMKVYSNAQTFSCGAQLQTVPYQPFPQQWHARYQALEEYGIDGTLESWSSGYMPNFMTELRAWYCWSEAPPLNDLLTRIARRSFGKDHVEDVVKAWDLFSQAARLVPDTGPYMGTTNAIGNPIFFEQPPARTATFRYSWMDQNAWMGYLGAEINPYWPYTVTRLTFIPDFSNRSNKAESYARGVSCIDAPADQKILPVFLKYLRLATDKLDEGLDLYRRAALESPSSKRESALREVIVAEQIHRMLLSNQAILTFEDLRLKLVKEQDASKAAVILDQMEDILRGEIARTERALIAVLRDSRIGFQYEVDYVYTPFSLREKLEVLREGLDEQIPAYRVANQSPLP
jgi:hypothetical protein